MAMCPGLSRPLAQGSTQALWEQGQPSSGARGDAALTVQEAVILEAAATEERVEGVQGLLALHRPGVGAVDVGRALRRKCIGVGHLRQLPVPAGRGSNPSGAVTTINPDQPGPAPSATAQVLGLPPSGLDTVTGPGTGLRISGREGPQGVTGGQAVSTLQTGSLLLQAPGSRHQAPGNTHLSFMSSGTPLSGNMEAMALKIISLGNCFLELFLLPGPEMIKNKTKKS